MPGKFKVAKDYRKNPLSKSESSISIELHYRDGSIRIYDNVHYPKSFCKKSFESDNQNLISHAILKDQSDQGIETIYKNQNGVQ